MLASGLHKTVLVVGNALRQQRLEAENRALRARVDQDFTMVGESYAMHQLREQVAMAAPTNGRVLISGENGTGKELVARSIHGLSRRRGVVIKWKERCSPTGATICCPRPRNINLAHVHRSGERGRYFKIALS